MVAKHTATIETEIDKIITDMATEEQEIKKSHGVAAEAMRKRAGWCGWLRGSSMGCGCVSGAQGHNVQATKATIENKEARAFGDALEQGVRDMDGNADPARRARFEQRIQERANILG